MGGLGDLRALVAATLTGLAPAGDDWPVHDGPVDSVTPPCYVIVWPDPWIEPATSCWYVTRVDVICIGARLDPLPGYVELEALVGAALPVLQAAGIALVSTGGAAPLEVGGLTYQAARIHLARTVEI